MQENSVAKKSSVVLYVALIALLSLPWYALMLSAKDLSIGRGLVVHTLMWCPTLAALLTCYWSGIAISSLGFSWPKMRYIGLGYGLPILYALLAYVPYWIVVHGSFDISQYAAASAASLKLHSLGGSLALNIFLLLGFGVISSISSGLGEEIGWRGFLFPSLFRLMGPTGAILISGLIWGFWHYPGILGANYNSGGPKWVAIVCFTWLVVAGAAIFGWLRVKSGSVWPAAIAHGSHNLFIQAICDPITRQDKTAAIWTTEFGILLAITASIVALLCWLKYPPRKVDSLVIESAEVPAMVG
jgi:membrane protease YdiL (CAAX protease family)